MKNKKSAVIICAGTDYKKEKIVHACKDASIIIAVDAGLMLLDRLKIRPDFILGDMDSVKTRILKKYKNIQTEIFPPEKDFTDSELGIIKAITYKPDTIKIFNATGDYFDHSLSNILNIFKYETDKTKIEIYTSNSKIFSINKNTTIKKSKNRRFSLFPFTEIDGFKMDGSKYNFKTEKKINIFNYSISNIIKKDKLSLKKTKGLLLCILFDDGYK